MAPIAGGNWKILRRKVTGCQLCGAEIPILTHNDHAFRGFYPPLNSLSLFAIRELDLTRGERPVGHASHRVDAQGLHGFRNFIPIRDVPMSSTFDTVAKIITETCDIPADTIKPESHVINDLGIDSLDFLDIAFAMDKAFGIKLPLEQWTQEVNDGKATTEQYFVMKNLCARIDALVAAKGA